MTRKTLTVAAPPAKAYTLRALVLSSLAEGTSRVKNPLLGQDQLHLIECLKSLGTVIEEDGKDLLVTGCAGRYHPSTEELNAGESGVSMNFLSSLTALCDREVVLTGKEGLLRRPIGEVIHGVSQLGGRVTYLDKEGFPPVRVHPAPLKGGRTVMSGSKTSQYFSSLVIAGALTEGETVIECSDEMSEKPYFDITTSMMEKFGVKTENREYREIRIPAGQSYRSCDIAVEGDYSSATFFFLAAAVCGTAVTVTGLNRDSVQGDREILPLLEKMGCSVVWNDGDVTVTGAPLKAIRADGTDIPDMVPSLAVAAAFAEGESVFTGVGRLRFKECDRLEAIRSNLEAMGGRVRYDEDNLYVTGTPLKGTRINSYNDHRIAMAFAVAGLATGDQQVGEPGCVSKSFPDFWERLEPFQTVEPLSKRADCAEG
ncbi:MAG: 3-phosphoshikimate 1-carboxyvinyltransferase [Spirochaetales bacterium]|nr:3-phosphoshikimate 1-carboxyvinyltransferase [Spirochaetales bacterium]